MRINWEHWVAGALGIIILLLIWFLPPAFGMQRASDIWILRGGIFALGAMGIGGLLWWAASKRQALAPPPPRLDPEMTQRMAPSPGAGAEEIELIIREAQQRLSASRLGRGATLGNLPAIFLVGDSGAGKTAVVLHSGLDPELLAGQVYQEGNIVPTRAANFWLARRTVFAEAGGPLTKDPDRWARFVKKLSPSSLHSVFGRKQQAPRAAVVCFDCETFTRPGAADTVTSLARTIHARLGEISQLLGISFPVYVVFTRADRLPFFTEFARSFTNDEIAQVFGTTLQPSTSAGTGVYAEQETKRLSAAFNNLFHSLCDWRVPLISREHDPAHRPAIYEFPREFRKLRSLAVQFMVDICRPSQLRTAPFLRGFYFTGLRTVVQQVAAAQTTVAPSPFAPSTSGAESATRMMSAADARAMLEAEAARSSLGGQSREVTQFVFLSHLFSHVILQDQSALGASAASTRVSGLRRALLATATVLALLCSIAFLVSFFGNRSLENRVTDAARAVPPPPAEAAGQPPSLDTLQKLEALRQQVVQLQQWQRDGAPWHLRMGLYSGDSVLAEARKIYFGRFHQWMFGETQKTLRANIGRVPATPGPTDEYSPIYDQLKAYLITTAHPDKSSKEWLTPVLLHYWPAGRDLDEERKKLATAQFDYYAEELKTANPFGSDADMTAVERARTYLSKFAATDPFYRQMREEARKRFGVLNFNRKYEGTAGVVNNNYVVEGAFFKDGWTFMQAAIQDPQKYLGGEVWVLGRETASGIDFEKLKADLKVRYLADFIKTWREFLNATVVVGYGSVQDASEKLKRHASNQPPLVLVFCEISANTAVDSPEVRKAFEAAQQIIPSNCLAAGTFVQPPVAAYVQAISPLQACLEQVNIAPPDQKDMMKQQCLQGTIQAKTAARGVTLGLKPDQEQKIDKTMGRLMEETIAKVEYVLKPEPGTEGICSAFARLKSKYPFSPTATTPATLEDVIGFFMPGSGVLSQFYEKNKADFLVQGQTYMNNPATNKFPARFITFFNQAMALQRALYPNNSTTLRYQFTLRQGPMEGMQGVIVSAYGQSHTFGIGIPSTATFTWPGTEPRVTLSLTGPDYSLGSYSGLWAMTEFIEDADVKTPIGANAMRIERQPKSGASRQPLIGAGGRPVKVVFDVDAGGAPFIFRKGAIAGMTCPTR